MSPLVTWPLRPTQEQLMPLTSKARCEFDTVIDLTVDDPRDLRYTHTNDCVSQDIPTLVVKRKGKCR